MIYTLLLARILPANIFSTLFFILLSLSVSTALGQNFTIDTTRFNLHFSDSTYILHDDIKSINLAIPGDFLANLKEELAEEEASVSSINFSQKVNSFEIASGLIALQLVSFETQKSGSAQAAAGRDIFLIYDNSTCTLKNTRLDFGITKQRSRYMGCLSAVTSHFILADIDSNGFTDIGHIKEEIKCDALPNDMLSKVYFVQKNIEWYCFFENSWLKSLNNFNLIKYKDLPLIGIGLNPVDFFAKQTWKSYDPAQWNVKSKVDFLPRYRQILINKEQSSGIKN